MGNESRRSKKIETSKLVREYNGDLTYSLNINDLNCKMEYIFANNKLIEIKYSFRPIIQNRTNPTAVG